MIELVFVFSALNLDFNEKEIDRFCFSKKEKKEKGFHYFNLQKMNEFQ